MTWTQALWAGHSAWTRELALVRHIGAHGALGIRLLAVSLSVSRLAASHAPECARPFQLRHFGQQHPDPRS